MRMDRDLSIELPKSYVEPEKKRFIDYLLSTNTVGMFELLIYMENTGFYTAPCSARHHLNRDGGLLTHSLSVLEFALKLKYQHDLPIDRNTIIKCAGLHDIFKMYCYEKMKGKWQYKGLGKMSNNFKRHGQRSLEIVKTFIKLTPQEEEMIAWHMGPYTEYYDNHKPGDFLKWSADKKNPNINAALFLYFCDHFSSMFLED